MDAHALANRVRVSWIADDHDADGGAERCRPMFSRLCIKNKASDDANRVNNKSLSVAELHIT